MISEYLLSTIPPFVADGMIVVRGTPEWEIREHARLRAGACLVGFGKLSRGKRVKVSDVLTELRR